jgi:F-type H+-transporting ATPase subunit delta
MKLTAHQYAKTLFEALQDTPTKDHDTVVENFAQALAFNNDITMVEEIAEEYEKLEKAGKGIKIAEVTSAHPLEKTTEHEIIEQLNELVQSKVELKKKIDEKIIGGVVIKVDDTLIDASVKRSLEDLKNNLTN